MFDYIADLKNIVKEAVNNFNENEEYLIKTDLSERCICARFAMSLTDVLADTRYRDYYVDVEYNRGAFGSERSAKRIEKKRIIVDLIVHKRGYNPEEGFNNLICIEMKKTTNRNGCNADEERLQKMINLSYGFNYKLAVMILINVKKHCLEIKDYFY